MRSKPMLEQGQTNKDLDDCDYPQCNQGLNTLNTFQLKKHPNWSYT